MKNQHFINNNIIITVMRVEDTQIQVYHPLLNNFKFKFGFYIIDIVLSFLLLLYSSLLWRILLLKHQHNQQYELYSIVLQQGWLTLVLQSLCPADYLDQVSSTRQKRQWLEKKKNRICFNRSKLELWIILLMCDFKEVTWQNKSSSPRICECFCSRGPTSKQL